MERPFLVDGGGRYLLNSSSSGLPTTLALMRGLAFQGDTVGALDALADHFEERLQAAMKG
jgi:hypothetical protein